MILRALVLGCVLATPAAALDLLLPAAARLTAERNTGPDRYSAPAGVFRNGQVVTLEVEGQVRRAAWRLSQQGLTPLQLIRPLRRQLVDAGFEILLDCAAESCGGFDFRFATETLPGPNMYVNIRAYHFITAVRPSVTAPQEVLTILASTAANSAFIQVIQAGEVTENQVVTEAPVPISPATQVEGGIGTRLIQQGHAVLRDLEFETGASELSDGSYESLRSLAEVLEARPDLRIALVGHTDTVGALEGNITLSRRRAQSVRQRMIDSYGIDGTRMEADGMGYLAPIASNLEAAGREENRRVEVVVLAE
ncbi:cell envelope biogenesis protein OmpA [Sulfitobacter alexandrii]|uniref:Cell envelope biogenesis protein OmpA n=1 Tax=Sulfitobacter alexandrii TaxID=1917485 RepID=A0A1J0WCY4_9RHOB|nr:OmpA family protein [Sulfitobacter alexandrii]APE42164.1 cell envelope biogenesis protein OmpA [Sulfitobacter alexandrii]